MRKKSRLTDYKNFWLIWTNCAGSGKGISLFSIQTDWGVKSNYLYHNESALGIPLFRAMIRQNYIRKEGKRLVAEFGWIPDFIKEKYSREAGEGHWFPDDLIRIKWGHVQSFIEKYHPVLFSRENMKTLYRRNKDLIGKLGSRIFTDVFMYVLFSNMKLFCKKYEAGVVLRIISTLISLSSDRDLLNYMHNIDDELKDVPDLPKLIKDESELSKILCTLKW